MVTIPPCGVLNASWAGFFHHHCTTNQSELGFPQVSALITNTCSGQGFSLNFVS